MNMALQVEDCADFLITLHTKFVIVFLFDHSYGHNRGLEDGFNVNQMGSRYGRLLHPEMHPTNINKKLDTLVHTPVSSNQGMYSIWYKKTTMVFLSI